MKSRAAAGIKSERDVWKQSGKMFHCSNLTQSQLELVFEIMSLWNMEKWNIVAMNF